ncbi:MAG: hypothetical protein COT56_01060 [Methylobacterium sp. CG09_land_8_20_14_0_10_71_15]|nr:MAG: hypothetical protein COT56_01060 [Methylobacterium sp. CG09_land_8_20_14_0_10_71_15]
MMAWGRAFRSPYGGVPLAPESGPLRQRRGHHTSEIGAAPKTGAATIVESVDALVDRGGPTEPSETRRHVPPEAADPAIGLAVTRAHPSPPSRGRTSPQASPSASA